MFSDCKFTKYENRFQMKFSKSFDIQKMLLLVSEYGISARLFCNMVFISNYCVSWKQIF